MCSSHWKPAGTGPYVLLEGLEARRDQVEEMTEFIAEFLST
jgi:hypothetical protein